MKYKHRISCFNHVVALRVRNNYNRLPIMKKILYFKMQISCKAHNRSFFGGALSKYLIFFAKYFVVTFPVENSAIPQARALNGFTRNPLLINQLKWI